MCAAILAVGVIIGILFLEETHAEKKHRRDLGLQLGRWILRGIGRGSLSDPHEKAEAMSMEESVRLLEDDEPPGYRTTDGTPNQQISRSSSPAATTRMALDMKVKEGLERKIGGTHRAFTRQVIVNIVAYGMLA